MTYDFTKSLEENQKLAREYATTVATAAMDFNKKFVEATAEAFNSVREQTVAVYKAMGVKIPGAKD
jgi:hypothetical protein